MADKIYMLKYIAQSGPVILLHMPVREYFLHLHYHPVCHFLISHRIRRAYILKKSVFIFLRKAVSLPYHKTLIAFGIHALIADIYIYHIFAVFAFSDIRKDICTVGISAHSYFHVKKVLLRNRRKTVCLTARFLRAAGH